MPRLHATFLVVLLAVSAAAASAAAAQAPRAETDFDPGTVVAVVGDRELTLGELFVRYATLPQMVRDRYGDRLDDFLRDTVADLLRVQEALSLGAAEDPLFEILMRIRRDEILRDLHGRRTVLSQIDEPTVTRRYDEQKTIRFERTARVRLRHLLVTPVREDPPLNESGDDAVGDEAARRKAEEARHRITAGEDFAEVARRLSEDASTISGGDLGWVEVEELVPQLAKTALTLPQGEVSDVLKSPLGYHVVEVLDRRSGGVVPYDLVRELLYQEAVGEQAAYFARSAREDRDRLLEEKKYEIHLERLP